MLTSSECHSDVLMLKTTIGMKLQAYFPVVIASCEKKLSMFDITSLFIDAMFQVAAFCVGFHS